MALFEMPLPWRQLHFSKRGSYSIERLNAFSNYSCQVSQRRAVSVSLLFLLPALLSSIALEFIPLQDPSDGVEANPGAWIRNFFIVFTNTISVLVQINQLIPQLSLPLGRILAIAVATSCCYMTMVIAIAVYWVYPTPFGLVISIPLGSVFVVLFFLLAVGPQRIRSSASLQRELKQQIKILAAQVVLAVVYPTFIAVCRRLSDVHRMLFVILLPVIKMITQQFIAWSAKDLEDNQPGMVVFCVDVFNAIYASKSMQSATQSARLMPFVIFGFDMLEFAFIMRLLHQQASLLNDNVRCQTKRTASSLHQPLLDASMDLCEHPGVLSTGTSLIRVHSSIVHSFSLPIQNAKTIYKPSTCGFLRRMPKIARKRKKLIQVAPVAIQDGKMTPRSQNPSPHRHQTKELSLHEKQELVHVALKLLFQCEYHLLVKYVECAVPMMYAIYVAVVQQLPSAAYYPETHGLNPSQSQAIVLNILLYAGLEVLLFLALHVVIKKQCGFSPTYLLAFVLENQTLELQSRLFLWYIILLQFTLVHFGKLCYRHLSWTLEG